MVARMKLWCGADPLRSSLSLHPRWENVERMTCIPRMLGGNFRGLLETRKAENDSDMAISESIKRALWPRGGRVSRIDDQGVRLVKGSFVKWEENIAMPWAYSVVNNSG